MDFSYNQQMFLVILKGRPCFIKCKIRFSIWKHRFDVALANRKKYLGAPLRYCYYINQDLQTLLHAINSARGQCRLRICNNEGPTATAMHLLGGGGGGA